MAEVLVGGFKFEKKNVDVYWYKHSAKGMSRKFPSRGGQQGKEQLEIQQFTCCGCGRLASGSFLVLLSLGPEIAVELLPRLVGQVDH